MGDFLDPDWNVNIITWLKSKINALNSSQIELKKTDSNPVKNSESNQVRNDESNQVKNGDQHKLYNYYNIAHVRLLTQ